MFTLGCEWGDKPVMLVSFKFFMEFGFNQVLQIFCSDCEIVAVCVGFEDLKVFTVKVIVQKIVIKFEHSEFGIVENKDTEMNR